MAIYALLNNTRIEILDYPLTIFQIRGLHENISWPEEPSNDQLYDYYIVIVQEIAAPAASSTNKVIVENDPVYDSELLCWKQSYNEILNTNDLSELKEEQLALLASTRYDNEIGGITWNGSIINTDRDSQMKLLSLYNMCLDGHLTEINWKCMNSEFIVLTAQDAITLSLTVAGHVKASFDRESVIMAQIKAATTVQDLAWTWVE